MSNREFFTSDLDSISPGVIAVFDSGVGGLTVLRALQAVLPGQSFVYLGDTARNPYGSKGKDTIVRYSLECATFLKRFDPKVIVVACNTATSLAFQELGEKISIPLVGTIESAVRATLAILESKSNSVPKRIVVLGTEATIRSQSYQRRIQEADSSVVIDAIACPLFVPFVEQGIIEGDIVDRVIDLYLHNIKESLHLRDDSAGAVILGCTHYPILQPALNRYFGGKVAIIDCATEMAKEVQTLLNDPDSGSTETDSTLDLSVRYFVTDDAESFGRVAGRFLGCGASTATKVSLEEPL